MKPPITSPMPFSIHRERKIPRQASPRYVSCCRRRGTSNTASAPRPSAMDTQMNGCSPVLPSSPKNR